MRLPMPAGFVFVTGVTTLLANAVLARHVAYMRGVGNNAGPARSVQANPVLSDHHKARD